MKKEIDDKILSQFVDSLNRLEQTNHQLALLQLVQLLYTDQSRAELLSKYQSLVDEDQTAYEGIRTASDHLRLDGKRNYEERVAEYGQAVVEQQMIPFEAASKERQRTTSLLSAFAKEHPHIVALHWLSKKPLKTVEN